jgi:hypothetical protein
MVLSANEFHQAMTPGEQSIIDVLLKVLIRYGVVDEDFNGDGWPRVRWDDALRDLTTGQAPLSEATYPYVTTYFPRPGDYIAAIITPDSRMILGPVGNSGTGTPTTGLGSNGIVGMSTTSVTIGMGEKIFVTEPTNLGYGIGQRLRLFSRGSTAYMEGRVTSYDGTTCKIESEYTVGAGAHTDWSVTVTGDRGDPGIAGAAATIAVGDVTTGAPGTEAAVVNSGTSSAAVLDFTIPRGNTGDQGISITGAHLSGGNLVIEFSSGPDVDVGSVEGPAGIDAPQIHTGSGAPSAGLGNDNDWYIQTGADPQGGKIYHKAAGAWSLVINFVQD